MRSMILVGMVAIVACDQAVTPGVDTPQVPVPLRFDRTLGTVKCMTEIGLNNAPCPTSSSSSTSYYVDSGRVVFTANGGVQWMLGTHVRQCSGGSCTDQPTVSIRTGSYIVAGDSITLTFDAGTPATRVLRKMQGQFPATATGWAGPDSLICLGGGDCGFFYTAVFLKSP